MLPMPLAEEKKRGFSWTMRWGYIRGAGGLIPTEASTRLGESARKTRTTG